jgi:uncharacterized membrane protein
LARPRALAGTALAAILVAGAALRVLDIDEDSLWIDEFASLQTSAGRPLKERYLTANVVLEPAPRLTAIDPAIPWTRVWWSLHDDNHLPVYFLLLRFWRGVFGDSEAALRMLSVLASVLAIGLLFDVLRVRHGTRVALWGSLLMAVAGLQIQFAREARPYALSLALVLGAASAFVRIERGSSGLRAGLALAGAATAALFTNYFAIGPLAGIGAYAVLGLRGRARRQASLALLFSFAVFVACWAPMAWAARPRVAGNAWLYDHEPGGAWRAAERVAAVPYRLLAGAAAFGVEIDAASPSAAVLPAVLLLPAILGLRRRELWLWHAWLAGCLAPLVVLDLATATRFLAVSRYLVLASPALFALVSAVPLTGRPWRDLVPAGAAALALWSVPAVLEPSKPPWREYAAAFQGLVGDAPVVLTAQDNGERTYLALCYYAYSPDRPVLYVRGAAGVRALERLRQEPVVWLLSSTARPQSVLPAAEVEDAVEWPRMPTLWKISGRRAAGVPAP